MISLEHIMFGLLWFLGATSVNLKA